MISVGKYRIYRTMDTELIHEMFMDSPRALPDDFDEEDLWDVLADANAMFLITNHSDQPVGTVTFTNGDVMHGCFLDHKLLDKREVVEMVMRVFGRPIRMFVPTHASTVARWLVRKLEFEPVRIRPKAFMWEGNMLDVMELKHGVCKGRS